MSTAAEDYAGGGEEQVFLLPHHNHQSAVDGGFFFHVPQHSRREKLRFPADDSLAPTAPSLPLFYQANTTAAAGLANFLPSSYYNVHEVDDSGSHHAHQIHNQGFSLSLSPAEVSPLGPFTGYAAVLNRSGFVEPARQLLEEICQLGRGDFAGCRDPRDAFSLDGELDKHAVAEAAQPWKKIKLASMLDEVQRKHRLCFQQVEAVRASFETVAGLNTAAPFVSMALKSMSRSFKSLKNAISSHLEKDSPKEFGKREIPAIGRAPAGDQACSEGRNYGPITFGQPNAWRPQRGLPDRAVAVLRAWLFEHFLHPYPTDTDKQILAKQTGLSRNQVSNWFINARVRLWKPMVEEIHNLELHQLQKSVVAEDNTNNNSNNNNNPRNSEFRTLQPSSSAAATYSTSSRPSESSIGLQRNYDNRLNRDYYDKPPSAELPHIEEPYSFAFDDFAGQGHGQALEGSSLVSLTLGLHQNNGAVCLPEPMPMNVTRRFGLEECGSAYILSAFEGQEMRQYGKEIGGLLLHDFVG